jgi:uncharacterized damage-inducible protein DinB
MPTMTEKDQLLSVLEGEAQTTLKIMRAYPASRMDFKPAEKSSSAAKLMWTFVLELQVAQDALNGAIDFSRTARPHAESHAEILSAYEAEVKRAVARVRAATEAEATRMVTVPVGPGKMGEVPARQFLWMMVMDSIHHRGQLSVYLRLVGAKVPSIYGPTADEPWM